MPHVHHHTILTLPYFSTAFCGETTASLCNHWMAGTGVEQRLATSLTPEEHRLGGIFALAVTGVDESYSESKRKGKHDKVRLLSDSTFSDSNSNPSNFSTSSTYAYTYTYTTVSAFKVEFELMWGMGIGGGEPSLAAEPSGLTRQPLHSLTLPSSLSKKRPASEQHHDDHHHSDATPTTTTPATTTLTPLLQPPTKKRHIASPLSPYALFSPFRRCAIPSRLSLSGPRPSVVSASNFAHVIFLFSFLPSFIIHPSVLLRSPPFPVPRPNLYPTPSLFLPRVKPTD
ncbi:hypothetical protein C8J55DRAFT_558180 [Lentinula edodes]|uniref:Uncharacterized protein n=1 Tax=Lentinula lateritia TaxID=40482 RepID=A0A9W9AR19_9AGAR|nr:hypothetical protein C8J55DRAFT_558180 [Lentinula edodes]